MKNNIFYIFFLLVFTTYVDFCFSTENVSSVWSGVGKGAHGDNGVLVLGINKETNVLTGYYEASDASGNGTNECKMYFSGELTNSSIDIYVSDANKESFVAKTNNFKGNILFSMEGGKRFALFFPGEKSWSCEWMYDGLPSYVPPKGFNLKTGLRFEFVRGDDFIAVGVVKASRAYFYAEPLALTARKAFLVAGDFFYVIAEKPDWYYVRFQGKKKETIGWVKKSDTLQFDQR